MARARRSATDDSRATVRIAERAASPRRPALAEGLRGGFERAIELLGEHGEPTLVVGREPALGAGSDDEDGVDADWGDVHRLRVHRKEGFELDAAGEEDEVGEVVAGGAPDGLVANRTERRR